MRSLRIGLFGLAAAVWVASATPVVPRAAGQREPARDAGRSAADARAALDKYCVGCHNGRVTGDATATGVVLDRLDPARVAQDAEIWERVVRRLRTGVMPPVGMPRPDPATHDALVTY